MRNILTDIIGGLVIFIALFAALSVVGQGDYEDAVQASEFYNEMVCDGHWPDYEDRKPTCEEV